MVSLLNEFTAPHEAESVVCFLEWLTAAARLCESDFRSSIHFAKVTATSHPIALIHQMHILLVSVSWTVYATGVLFAFAAMVTKVLYGNPKFM